jgi:hypothetical protein
LANYFSKLLIIPSIKTVNKVNKYFGFCSDIYSRKALSCQFYLKITETYTGQNFSDHLAGFYFYLGSILI